ncbi:MAG: S-layer homology domain-containing protein [Candidatus Gracilibacteria bacterium]|nr:S-layer homology domain-containing protein [Candidatus Gracilibacteria bacterium]
MIKKYLLSISILTTLISAYLAPAFAEPTFLFPLPTGKHRVTSSYSGHHSRLKTVHKSLDFQAAEIPTKYLSQVSEDVRTKGARCYSYGVPILASRAGTVIFTDDTVKKYKDNSYGNYVIIEHDDGSKMYYAHMIKDTLSKYVSVNDTVQAGQILGLMGDTGTIISSSTPCEYDNNKGTHLHFESRNYTDDQNNILLPEPLGGHSNIANGSTLTSTTIPYDPKRAYSQYHYGVYPYILELHQVHSITPLQATGGSNTTFTLTGKNFAENVPLTLLNDLCTDQTYTYKSQNKVEISCAVTTQTGLKTGVFSAPNQPEGKLEYQIEVQAGTPSNVIVVNKAEYIPTAAGDYMDIDITGKNFTGDLLFDIYDIKFKRNQQAYCKKADEFYLLSAGHIKLRCKLPLNLGAVSQDNERNFSFEIFRNRSAKNTGEAPLYTNNFEVNYGISINELTPRSAIFYTPTRFTITGKNVQRITTYFMEGCQTWKLIESSTEKLTIECEKIVPTTDENLDGKSFRHLFIFKTRSKKNLDGTFLTDEEDQANIVISGYIDLSNNQNTEVHKITPQEAVVGTETTFNIVGINLPFTDSSDTQPLVWLEECAGLNILPSTYTTYGFDFTCTPQFTASEQSEYNKIEEQYSINDDDPAVRTQKKKAVWPLFNEFFENLSPKQVHVKQLIDGQKKVFPKQTIQYISALYKIIRDEESFQFDYPRVEEGTFSGGEPSITRIVAGGINRNNRHQKITVTGRNLPKTLQLDTKDCSQVAVVLASPTKYEFMCLLKKVSVQELQFIDGSTKTQLDLRALKVQEVYDVSITAKENNKYNISITGVNLSTKEMNIRIGGNCGGAVFVGTQSTSEMVMECTSTAYFFHPKTIDISIKDDKDSFNYFEELVEIKYQKASIEPKNFQANILRSQQNLNTNTNTESSKIISTSEDGEMVIDAKILKLICEGDIEPEFFLGQCNAYSELLREASVIAHIDTVDQVGYIEGKFDTRLAKGVDDFTTSKLGGLKINPASGYGLAMINVPKQSLLVNGEFKAFGIDASQPLGFPFAFDMYDFSGEFTAVYPSFNINKSRANSKLMFGMGNINHPSISIMKAEREKLKKNIEEHMKTLNSTLQTKKIELGAKLIGSINDYELKKLARVSYIKVLKELEIVPVKIALYDNFDFEAVGKLKSEPFRPSNWPKNSEWVAEANIAELDIDFVAKEGKLSILGNALNELSLFNNDFIKAENGLLETGLTIELKRDHGRIELNPLTVRLPYDIYKVEADAYASHIFKPSQLGVMGRIKSSITLKGIELAKSGAAFQLDPNITYRVGDYESTGVLRIDGKLFLVGLEFEGGTVFTMPSNELAMDLGGQLNLDFLGVNKTLGKVLSRARLGDTLQVCANADSGKITFSYPGFFKTHEITLNGGVSLETEVEFDGNLFVNIPQPKTIAVSGETTGISRSGIKVTVNNLIIPVPTSIKDFNQKCEDAPNDEFFKTSLLAKNIPKLESSQLASVPLEQSNTPVLLAGLDDSLMGEALSLQNEYKSSHYGPLAQNTTSNSPSTPTWDMTGWIILAVEDLNGNEIVITKNGQAFDLQADPYGVDGMWFSENPDEYVIYDEKAFNEAGFEIVLNQITAQGSDFTIATYTNEKQTASEFRLPQLKFNENILEFQSIIEDREISIGQQTFSASDTKVKRLSEKDRSVESTVTSDDYNDLKVEDKATNDAQIPKAPIFSDLSESHPHYDAIQQLTSMGVLNGYSDGTFRPDQTVNRAEFVKMILESFAYPLIDKKTPSFKDSQPSDWHYKYIETAKFQEMIKGYKNRLVKPGQTIIKAEGLKILLEAAKLNISSSTTTPFSDVSENQWYASYVATALENNIKVSVTRGGRELFEPTHNLTRAEVADLIVQVL